MNQICFKLFFCCILSVLCLVHYTQATWPSQIVNISSWKLTLPLGEPKRPMEIFQPTLNQYIFNPYFGVGPNKTSVRFRVMMANDTVTTKGSQYPRTELREMDSINPSSVKAAWNTSVGIHTMIIDQTITRLPTTRKKLVAGQIHGGDKFVVIISLDTNKLYINLQGGSVTITRNYVLGTRFLIKIQVKDGVTSIYYNDMTNPFHSFTSSYAGAYFKAGCYAQSNCAYEGSLCGRTNNYAEVLIHNLTITHEYPEVVTHSGFNLFGQLFNQVTSNSPSMVTGLSQQLMIGVLISIFVTFQFFF